MALLRLPSKLSSLGRDTNRPKAGREDLRIPIAFSDLCQINRNTIGISDLNGTEAARLFWMSCAVARRQMELPYKVKNEQLIWRDRDAEPVLVDAPTFGYGVLT